MLHGESKSRRSGPATVLNRQTVRQDRRSSERGCNIEKNLGFKPMYWGGFGITASRLRCQDASTGREYWHVMQPWATRAKRWCIEKKKKIYTENPYLHMNEHQGECMALSKRFLPKVWWVGGRSEGVKICTQNKVLSVEEKKLAGGVFCTCQ